MLFTAVGAAISDDLNERLNQTLVDKIRSSLNESQKKVGWTTIAKNVVEKYETEHTETKFASSNLLEGENIYILVH